MSDSIKIILQITWTLLLVYWIASGFKSKHTKSQEPFLKRIVLYWLPLLVAMYLLGPGEWFGHTLIRENFVPHTNTVGVIGLFFSITGMLIACWARYLLGKNWSLSVQKKEDHQLVTIGIYNIVRHPIYTGLLLMFFGNAIIVGDYRGLIAVAIVFISFWFKYKKEEHWLTELFGDKYIAYQKRTKAIIPFLL